MIRRTSAQAFNQIKEEGLLKKMRFEAYKLLFKFGPMTANQLMAKAKELNPNKSHQAIESIGRRLSELRDQGVVVEIKETTCPVSKRNCIQWDVTEKLPVKFEKPKRKKCSHCKGKGYHQESQGRFF